MGVRWWLALGLGFRLEALVRLGCAAPSWPDGAARLAGEPPDLVFLTELGEEGMRTMLPQDHLNCICAIIL